MEICSPLNGAMDLDDPDSVETIPHPKQHFRRPLGLEGETGPQYEAAFLDAQKEIGPVIATDAENAFNKSKYTSLAHLLATILPAANRYGLTVKQGAGRLIMYGGVDNAKRLLLLPIWTIARHSASGQWERVTIEIPLLKIDPQGLASAFTYGRRYALQALFCLAGTDDDGVLGSLKPRLEANPVDDDLTSGLIEQINECDTLDHLKGWYKRNEQGFELLSEAALNSLREAYSKHSAFLKTASVPKKVKANAGS